MPTVSHIPCAVVTCCGTCWTLGRESGCIWAPLGQAAAWTNTLYKGKERTFGGSSYVSPENKYRSQPAWLDACCRLMETYVGERLEGGYTHAPQQLCLLGSVVIRVMWAENWVPATLPPRTGWSHPTVSLTLDLPSFEKKGSPEWRC